MSRMTVDLHPIYNRSRSIDEALQEAIRKVKEDNIKEVEIIYGKGSGQLKKRVLKFLDQKDIKQEYKRIKKDPQNSGRVFVYFK